MSHPFLLHPVELALPAEELIGAEVVHREFRRWLVELGHAGAADLQAVPARASRGPSRWCRPNRAAARRCRPRKAKIVVSVATVVKALGIFFGVLLIFIGDGRWWLSIALAVLRRPRPRTRR